MVLGARSVIKKPVRPLVASAKTLLADQIKHERESILADKVLSADVRPKQFPVKADQFTYPTIEKLGADNPLYATSSGAYGGEQPMAHQITDRYFPSTNNFTKGFVTTKPRYTGLV